MGKFFSKPVDNHKFHKLEETKELETEVESRPATPIIDTLEALINKLIELKKAVTDEGIIRDTVTEPYIKTHRTQEKQVRALAFMDERALANEL